MENQSSDKALLGLKYDGCKDSEHFSPDLVNVLLNKTTRVKTKNNCSISAVRGSRCRNQSSGLDGKKLVNQPADLNIKLSFYHSLLGLGSKVVGKRAMDSLCYNISLYGNATGGNETSTHLSSSFQVQRAFKVFFLVLIALANIIGNSSICVVAFKDRHLRVTVRNYVVASLALSDLLAIQIMVFQGLTYYNIGKEPFFCDLIGRMFGCLLYISNLHLFTLSMDRYIAIFYPLRYRFLVTPKRTAVILLTIWTVPVFSVHILPAVISGLRGFSSFYGCTEQGLIEVNDRTNQLHMCMNVAVLFFFPLLVMMVAYYRISKIAWYQANRVGVAIQSVVRVFGGRLPRARERKWAKTLGKLLNNITGLLVSCLFGAQFVKGLRSNHAEC